MHLSEEEHLELLRSVVKGTVSHEREKGLFDTEESLRLWLKTARECFRQGVEGAVQDSVRLSCDWGFRVEDVRKDLKVWLWYGRYDEVAPVGHGEQYKERLGGNARLRVVDETHGSMFVNRTEAYLRELVDCEREMKVVDGT